MRLIDERGLAIMRRRNRRVNYHLQVLYGSRWVALNKLYGRDWVKSIMVSEDQDNPSMELSFEVQREWEKTSLSPLMRWSRANRNGEDVYDPLLKLDTQVILWVSVSSDSDFNENWMQVFRGRVTSVDPSVGENIRVVCRDPMHDLVTRWIEAKETELGTEAGQPVENLIQGIVNAWGGGVPLFTPISPNWLVTPYKQERMPVYEALNTIVLQFGWDLRYRFIGYGSQLLSLIEPARSDRPVDFTFHPDSYYDLTGLDSNLDGVRNVIIVEYGPKSDRRTQTQTSSSSIQDYRLRRPMWISEADTSPLQTRAAAERMARACLFDLRQPKFNMNVTMPVFPWVQIGDVYTFPGNEREFSNSIAFACVGYTHTLGGAKASTQLRLRDGNPSGAFNKWLEREDRRGVKFF